MTTSVFDIDLSQAVCMRSLFLIFKVSDNLLSHYYMPVLEDTGLTPDIPQRRGAVSGEQINACLHVW